jgi:repressor LexA
VLDEAPWRQKRLTPIPLIGKVTAGQPILAIENIEETYPLPTELVGEEETFMLTVQGDSMMNAGILDGDLIIVRVQRSANNGDIIVAMIDDEATVKRFYKEHDRIRLQPENPAYDPIFSRDVTILGKVIGVFRLL